MTDETHDSPPSIEVLDQGLRRLGHVVSPESLKEIHAVMPALQDMKARVRRCYDRAAEPAHTFSAAASAETGVAEQER